MARERGNGLGQATADMDDLAGRRGSEGMERRSWWETWVRGGPAGSGTDWGDENHAPDRSAQRAAQGGRVRRDIASGPGWRGAPQEVVCYESQGSGGRRLHVWVEEALGPLDIDRWQKGKWASTGAEPPSW
jgi:hypothetical protein